MGFAVEDRPGICRTPLGAICGRMLICAGLRLGIDCDFAGSSLSAAAIRLDFCEIRFGAGLSGLMFMSETRGRLLIGLRFRIGRTGLNKTLTMKIMMMQVMRTANVSHTARTRPYRLPSGS